jgi:hypothetical protein
MSSEGVPLPRLVDVSLDSIHDTHGVIEPYVKGIPAFITHDGAWVHGEFLPGGVFLGCGDACQALGDGDMVFGIITPEGLVHLVDCVYSLHRPVFNHTWGERRGYLMGVVAEAASRGSKSRRKFKLPTWDDPTIPNSFQFGIRGVMETLIGVHVVNLDNIRNNPKYQGMVFKTGVGWHEAKWLRIHP